MALRFTRRIAILGAFATLAPASAAEPSCEPARWIDASQPFCVALPSEAPRSGLRVYLGRADVSMWFRVAAAGHLLCEPGAIALPSGEQELIVRAPSANGWQEVTHQTVKILAHGLDLRSGRSALNLSVNAQPDSGARHGTATHDRGRFADLEMQSALGFELARAGALWRFDSEFVGSSYRNASLRFATLGERAPRVDLGQYQLAFERGGTEARLGHFAVTTHPLLLQDFDSRGLQWRHRIGRAVELSVASVNGSTIVGYDNLLGLADSKHRIDTINAGIELRPNKPGTLRLELSWLNGSARSTDDFNVGQVGDAEHSQGGGIRLTGIWWSGRLRSDLAVAHSRYFNPRDEALAQGLDIVEVRPATARAAFVDVRGQALRPAIDDTGAEIVVHGRAERTEPLFGSVGSSQRVDYQLGQAGIDATWRDLALSLTTQRHEDNLDKVPTILRTRTTTHSLTGNADLASWVRYERAASLWPTLTFRVAQQRQVARNAPPSFQATHLPDQANREMGLGMRWATPRWEWTLEIAETEQDNRQPGREFVDYGNLSEQFGTRFSPHERFSIALGGSRVRNHSVEQDRSDYTHAGWLSLQWDISRHWRFAGHYSLGRDFDSRALGDERNVALQSELTGQYDLRGFAARLPLQVFLRHSLTRGTTLDRVFALETRAREWQVAAGFNINFR